MWVIKSAYTGSYQIIAKQSGKKMDSLHIIPNSAMLLLKILI